MRLERIAHAFAPAHQQGIRKLGTRRLLVLEHHPLSSRTCTSEKRAGRYRSDRVLPSPILRAFLCCGGRCEKPVELKLGTGENAALPVEEL
jgi:hypothetical protein